MGYAVYERGDRFAGYGVPAYCDFPECLTKIDRGVDYLCESRTVYRFFDIDSGEELTLEEADSGTYDVTEMEYEEPTHCDMFFCGQHTDHDSHGFTWVDKGEHPDWVDHLLDDESWQQWRDENEEEVQKLIEQVVRHV